MIGLVQKQQQQQQRLDLLQVDIRSMSGIKLLQKHFTQFIYTDRKALLNKQKQQINSFQQYQTITLRTSTSTTKVRGNSSDRNNTSHHNKATTTSTSGKIVKVLRVNKENSTNDNYVAMEMSRSKSSSNSNAETISDIMYQILDNNHGKLSNNEPLCNI